MAERRRRVSTKEPDLFKRAFAQREITEHETLLVNEIGFYPRAMCQIALPVSRFTGNEYVRNSGRMHLSIMAPAQIGVPWGIRPRGALMWIATEVAKKKNSGGENPRVLHLGNSLLEFYRKVSGGTTYSGGVHGNIGSFRRQMQSLFSSRIFFWVDPVKGAETSEWDFNGMQVATRGSMLWNSRTAETPSLFPGYIELSQEFYDELARCAVPLDLRAVAALWPACLPVDIYVWLTYRTYSLLEQGRHSLEIPWPLLKLQFGQDYRELKQFRYKFLEALDRVRSVFPSLEFQERDRSMFFRFKRPAVLSISVLEGKTLREQKRLV